MDTGARPEFVPISPNPFVVGNPIRGRSMFFGRESEFELVRKRFQGQERGALLVFCGERRSGKTSILFQILDGRLGSDFVPVLIDMQSMAVDDEASFLEKIATEIREAAGLPAGSVALELEAGENEADAFQQFVKRVLALLPGKKLILLFDEYELFENKIDAGHLSPDVLHVLASLMQLQAVFLIFTGSQHLEERKRDYWAILGKSLFRTISYLEREDAVHLIRRPVEGRVHYQGDAVERILRLTAGQPFYTQAVCQNLVDRLNSLRTNDADAERLSEVTRDLVENPLPQMIFLWDGLEREDKLVFAVLAETLESSDEFAQTEDLERHIRRRRYPLRALLPVIPGVLEKLFRQEMLLKAEGPGPARYAFRMDLWRLWVRRMHSVWQVVREQGIQVPPPGARWRYVLPASVAASLILVSIAWWRGWFSPATDPREVRAPDAWLALDVLPLGAEIAIEGRRVGLGRYHGRLPAGLTQEVKISASGHADSILRRRLEPAETLTVALELRPLLGDLEVSTDPSGADVTVDGVRRGPSPVLVRSLPVPATHTVEASLSGHATASGSTGVTATSVTRLQLRLPVGTAELRLASDPPGAEILLAGVPSGGTPALLTAVPVGIVPLRLRLTGYETVDTSLVIRPGANSFTRPLVRLPNGTLIVQGDRPAQIFVNDRMVQENTQNSRVAVSPGSHTIHVVLLNGETIDTSLTVASRERVVFDYSSRIVRRTTGS
jgi:hypothetical protein